MYFSILGPLVITDDDGERIHISQPLKRALLSYMIFRIEQSLSAADVIRAVWNDDDVERLRGTLQTHIWGIRKLNQQLNGRFVNKSGRYLIKASRNEVDLWQFRSLASNGQSLLRRGNIADARVALTEALRLWRGPPLVDLPDTPVLMGESARLLEERSLTAEQLIDARLMLGEAATLIPELKQCVSTEPLREYSWAQLMIALYRAGRTAEALASYMEIDKKLREEAGVEPCNQMQQLHQRMLDNDPELDNPGFKFW